MIQKRTIIALVALACCLGCSTKKNTWATRSYHTTTTRYNIHFNAKTNYDEGIQNMNKAHIDDFSQTLPLFPISVHSNGQSIASNMDITIEKCRKAIKNHSIKVKPKKDPKRMKDPKYQRFLAQEDFNPMIKQAWVMIGKAEFHKALFMEAGSTFSYTLRHFPSDPEITTECRIWMARCYAEMDWLFEAEEVLGKINENDVTQRLTAIFAATRADLFLKQKRYNEAIPFLEIAANKEKDRYQRMRFNFVLGQLFLQQNDSKKAIEHFTAVTKANPAYLFNFNAQLAMLQVDKSNPEKSVKQLTKMAKNDNNAEYLDQIYCAIANIYLQKGDEAKAIENYKLAIEKSTRNGAEKAVTLVTLGDLYCNNKKYVEAHPCFEEAVQVMKNTHDDYPRVEKLAAILGDIAVNYNQIVLQDSLQQLSKLSDKEQRAVVDKIIERVIKEEEEAKKREAEELAASQGDPNFDRFGGGGFSASDLLGGGNTDWYFYNPQLVNKGRAEFQRRWGRRKLEDNWRRINKVAQILSENNENLTEEQLDSLQQANPDSIVDNTKKPEYYLAQIPKTPEQIEKSNELIADALFALADIYKNKMEDYEAAIEVSKQFQQRFPNDKRKVDSYYSLYQIFNKKEETTEAEVMRKAIINEFPESKYAIILSQPDYTERMAKMYKMQDDLYQKTYKAYASGDFATVSANYNTMAREYPLSTLLPKFAFLNALSVGKTRPQNEFFDQLSEVVKKFPDSDVTPMAKDILALMNQGEEAQQGGKHGSLMERREELLTEADEVPAEERQFAAEKNAAFNLIFVLNTEEKEENNRLVFDFAAFNFTKFMIKDFDLALRKIDDKNCLVISNFESYEEVLWYEKMLIEEPTLVAQITPEKCSRVRISSDNLALIGTYFNWQQYAEFFDKNF